MADADSRADELGSPGRSNVPSQTRPDESLGYAAVSGAVLLFSWGFILVKLVPLSAVSVSFWRLVFGVVILGSVTVVGRIPRPVQWRDLLGAGLTFGLHQLLFTAATKQTSISTVTLAGATQPLLVALVSRRAVGEPVKPALFACASLALVGVGIVIGSNLGAPSRSLRGDLLAMINAVSFTTYFVFAKRARIAGAPTVTFTLYFLALALLVVGPASLLSGGPQLPTLSDAALLLLMALGPGNGHLLLNWAHRRVRATMSSLLLTMVPLLSSLWAHLVFGEPLTVWHLVGIGLVMLAVEGGRRASS